MDHAVHEDLMQARTWLMQELDNLLNSLLTYDREVGAKRAKLEAEASQAQPLRHGRNDEDRLQKAAEMLSLAELMSETCWERFVDGMRQIIPGLMHQMGL